MSQEKGKYPLFSMLLGPAIFFCMLLLPIGGMEYETRGALGLLIWMIAWWILLPVKSVVTSLLPIFATTICGIGNSSTVFGEYFSSTIMLMLGANLMTVSWIKWGLDKRMGLFMVSKFGSNPMTLIVAWFAVGAIISSFVGNVVVVCLLLPIVVVTLKAMGIDATPENVPKSNYACISLLAAAWGGSVGFLTPLGGAMNLITIQYIEEMVTGQEFMYIDWTIRMLPMVLTACASLLFVLYKSLDKKSIPTKSLDPEVLKAQYRDLGPMQTAEKISLMIFLLGVFACLGRPLFESLLPTFTAQNSFFALGLLTLLLPANKEGDLLLPWGYAAPRIEWSLLYNIGGIMAIGKIVTGSGAGQIIADSLMGVTSIHPMVSLVLFSLMACILSNLMTIGGSMAVMIPIIISTMNAQGLDPIATIFIVCAVGNVSFMLPTSCSGSIVVGGYGVETSYMAKVGLKVVALGFVTVLIVGYLYSIIWPGFGVL